MPRALELTFGEVDQIGRQVPGQQMDQRLGGRRVRVLDQQGHGGGSRRQVPPGQGRRNPLPVGGMARRDRAAVLEGDAGQGDGVGRGGEGAILAGDLVETGAHAAQGVANTVGKFLEHGVLLAAGNCRGGARVHPFGRGRPTKAVASSSVDGFF
jgi:hypothetical protein